MFDKLVELLHKIDLWWVINIEIPTNSDYDGQEINEKDVKVGSVMVLQMVIDIALGVAIFIAGIMDGAMGGGGVIAVPATQWF